MFPFAFVRCGWALIVTQITHANGELASISTIVLFILNFLTAKKQKTKVSRVSFYLYIKYFKHVFFVYVHFSISREYLIQLRVSLSHSTQIHELATKKQQCIPVGCVPSAAVAVSGGTGCLPRGCLPRHPS